MPVEKISGRARRRRKKRAKNQARKDERTALYVAIRMEKGAVPEWVKHMPNHRLKAYVDDGCRWASWNGWST
jgi:hypothetical protein